MLALAAVAAVAAALSAGGAEARDVLVPLLNKCGTSHLHRVLASHPAIHAHPKEGCKFSEPRGGDNKTDLWTMCLANAGAASWAREVPPGPSTKVILLLRDPADFFWAAYNFWSSPGDAKITHAVGGWTSKQTYRSPEHAHEILRSGGKLFNYHFIDQWRAAAALFADYRDVFGAENVLALRTEDLGDEDTWHRVAGLLGLPPGGFDARLIGRKTNSGADFASRGMGIDAVGGAASAAAAPSAAGGLYEASGRRPMLCETRDLVYNLTRDACKRLDREFGLRWDFCHDGGASACPGVAAKGAPAAAKGAPAVAECPPPRSIAATECQECAWGGLSGGYDVSAAAFAGILLFALGYGAGCASSGSRARLEGARAAELAGLPSSAGDGEKAAIMRDGKGGGDGLADVACDESSP